MVPNSEKSRIPWLAGSSWVAMAVETASNPWSVWTKRGEDGAAVKRAGNAAASTKTMDDFILNVSVVRDGRDELVDVRLSKRMRTHSALADDDRSQSHDRSRPA